MTTQTEKQETQTEAHKVDQSELSTLMQLLQATAASAITDEVSYLQVLRQIQYLTELEKNNERLQQILGTLNLVTLRYEEQSQKNFSVYYSLRAGNSGTYMLVSIDDKMNSHAEFFSNKEDAAYFVILHNTIKQIKGVHDAGKDSKE